jgi:hypothetical protein
MIHAFIRRDRASRLRALVAAASLASLAGCGVFGVASKVGEAI